MSTISGSSISSVTPVTAEAATALSTSPLVDPSPRGINIGEAFFGAGLAIAYAYMAPSSLLGHLVTPIGGAVLGVFAGSAADYVAREVHQLYFTSYYKPYILYPEISRVLPPLKRSEVIEVDRVLDEERDLMQKAFLTQIISLPGYREWAERNNLHTINETFMHLQTAWRIGTCYGQNQEIIKKILAAPQRPLPQILRSINIADIFVTQSKHKFEVSAGLDRPLETRTDLKIKREQAEFSSALDRVARGEPIEEAKSCGFTINTITADTIHELLRPLQHPTAINPSPALISLNMQWGITPEILETVGTTFGAERDKLAAEVESHTMLLYRNCGDPKSPFYIYNSLQPYDGLFEFRDLETCSKMVYALAKHRVMDLEDWDTLYLSLESNRAPRR